MENIFYAAIARHIAGKPINKENIKAVLKAAGTPVDETALDAVATFVEALETARKNREKPVDPRIIKFLVSELTKQKVQIGRLEAVLEEFAKPVSFVPSAETQQALPLEDKVTAKEEQANAEARVEDIKTGGTSEGRYVYGVAINARKVRLGPIGIESNDVYTIPYREFCAIVHNCPAEPYQSSDDEIVKGWVRTHQSVLDEATRRFGTVIPIAFDVILQSKDGVISPDQVVKDWLKEDYDRLRTIIEKIQGKDEYGVQVWYEAELIHKWVSVSEQSEEIRKIKEQMTMNSPGIAYIYKQKLEKAVKSEVERLANEWFKDFYTRIKKHCEDVVVEKTKKVDQNKVMLLNLSCLVAKEKADGLGEELERINNVDGFSVRFTGPWPPYSFVGKPTIPIPNAKEGSDVT